MKTVEKIKKMVALGMGLTMVGATVFGASALQLSDYPKPFVVNGTPASNLAIVVGDDAAASDTLGAVDIIQGLQAAAVSTEAGSGSGPRVRVLGDSVEIGTPTDLLELNESLGDVRKTLTEFDLNMLKGGSITTRRGVTKYNQYINLPFNETVASDTVLNVDSSSSRVIFDEDEFDNVGHFLHWKDGQTLFQWVLEFEEGLTSDVEGIRLRDLEDRNVNVLGTEYAIVATQFNTSARSARLDLLGGPVYDALGEGDKKTYTLDGREYEVEVVVISETAGEVLLKVNGQALPRLRSAETEPAADGTLVGIRDIIATGKDTQSSVVRFYLGASDIELRDTLYNDSSYTTAGAIINNEVIEDADVRIRAADTGSNRLTLSDVAYRLRSDALVGDMFVPPGHGVREYLDEPEGMIAPYWDIRYEGLLDTGTTLFKLNPIGRDEYKLEFTNQEGLHYVVPFMSTRQDGSLRFGDFTSNRARDLRFMEGDNADDHTVRLQDYFVLSDIETGTVNAKRLTNTSNGGSSGLPSFLTGQTDNTAFTRVLKYESVDTTNKVLTFTDLATGTKQVTYDDANNSNLVVGGITYTLHVLPFSTSEANLSVDLDGDGSRFNGTSILSLEGGGLFLFAGNASPHSIWNPKGAGIVSGPRGFSMVTLSKQFDESSGDEAIGIAVEKRANNRIGLNRSLFTNLNMLFLTSEPEIAQALTKYGAFWELFDPLTTDTPEELTIEYPMSQRGVQVFVTSGQVSVEQVAGGENQRVNPIQVGVSKLASEVADMKAWNAIVVGGPCANPLAAELMGNPEKCWEAVPENKAIVRLYEHTNGNVALLVAGRSAMNTRMAARALQTGKLAGVAAKEATVSGTSVSQIDVMAA